MMQDVMDLRENNWVPRREDNNPKTIDQIYKEAAEKAMKLQMAVHMAKQVKKLRGGFGFKNSSINLRQWQLFEISPILHSRC